jgi:hypothetical protein
VLEHWLGALEGVHGQTLSNRPQRVLAAVLAGMGSADGPIQFQDIHTGAGALLNKPPDARFAQTVLQRSLEKEALTPLPGSGGGATGSDDSS